MVSVPVGVRQPAWANALVDFASTAVAQKSSRNRRDPFLRSALLLILTAIVLALQVTSPHLAHADVRDGLVCSPYVADLEGPGSDQIELHLNVMQGDQQLFNVPGLLFQRQSPDDGTINYSKYTATIEKATGGKKYSYPISLELMVYPSEEKVSNCYYIRGELGLSICDWDKTGRYYCNPLPYDSSTADTLRVEIDLLLPTPATKVVEQQGKIRRVPGTEAFKKVVPFIPSTTTPDPTKDHSPIYYLLHPAGHWFQLPGVNHWIKPQEFLYPLNSCPQVSSASQCPWTCRNPASVCYQAPPTMWGRKLYYDYWSQVPSKYFLEYDQAQAWNKVPQYYGFEATAGSTKARWSWHNLPTHRGLPLNSGQEMATYASNDYRIDYGRDCASPADAVLAGHGSKYCNWVDELKLAFGLSVIEAIPIKKLAFIRR